MATVQKVVTRREPKPLPAVVETYRSQRDQRIGDGVREDGELVPEAYTWPLVESVIRSGYLRECAVSGETFAEAVRKYCPELAEELGDRYDIDPAHLKGE